MLETITSKNYHESPFLSVIIPSYNPTVVFDECLASVAIACRELPDQVEVYVIDDCSKEPFINRVESHGFHYVRMLQRSGAGATRNHGAQLATGSILLFIDYDVVVPPNSFKQVLDHFDNDLQLTALSARPAIDNGIPGFFNAYKCLFSYNLFNRTPRNVCYIWTSFAAIQTNAFHRAGGFATHYKYAGWEDVEMGLSLSSLGYRIINTDLIEVTHKHHYNLKSLIKNDWKRVADYMKLLIHNRVIIRRLRCAGQFLQNHEKLSVPFSVLLLLDLLIAILSFDAILPRWIGIYCALAAPFLLLIFVLSLKDSIALAWRTHGAIFAMKSLLTSFALSNISALAGILGLVMYLYGQSGDGDNA